MMLLFFKEDFYFFRQAPGGRSALEWPESKFRV